MRDFKERLLQKCIAQQNQVIGQLQKEIEDAQKQANDYGQPKDRYDAYRTKLMRQIELFAKQQDKAKVVLNTLNQIPLEKDIKVVEFGAVVMTNKQNLFISAGLGKMEFEGKTFFAISPLVPIFNALKGKQAGDTLTFNGNTISITEVF